jgi:hypothetical protein
MVLLDSDLFTLLTYGHANVCRHDEAGRAVLRSVSLTDLLDGKGC